jgi:hypothetical protein
LGGAALTLLGILGVLYSALQLTREFQEHQMEIEGSGRDQNMNPART